MRDGGGERHDALVIGAGFGGLTAACFLARQGLDTVMIEAGERAGGCCRTVEDGGLSWNLSLYSMRGCRPGGPFIRLLEELDLDGGMEFLHSPRSYLVRAGQEAMPVTSEVEEMIGAAERFERGGSLGLKKFIDAILSFHPVRDYSRLSRETFADAAAREGVTGRLLDAVGAPLMISLGLPPSRTSAYFAFMKYQLLLREGVSYPKGGPGRLVEAFLRAFAGEGGTVHCQEKAEIITPLSSGGWEIRTSRGRTLRARYVVFTGDATSALEKLAPHLPKRLVGRTGNLHPSVPASLLFLHADAATFASVALDTWPHRVFLPEDGLEEHYRDSRGGKTRTGSTFFGLTSPLTWEPAREDRPEKPITAFFLSTPGAVSDFAFLRRSVEEGTEQDTGSFTLRSALGPDDLQSMTLNRDGAFCGWEMGPERYGRSRLPRKILPGFYLAGHWVDPGPSLLNAALSGREAARAVLRDAGMEPS